jgi:hypothetical protein
MSMHTIKVKKTELLDVLRKNREAHRDIFEKACVGYRKVAVEELERSLADARAGRKIRQNLALIEPMDQTKDYDRAIRMLEMSIEDTIELDEQQFAQYVQDDWRWKEQFTASNSRYTR